MLDLSRLKLKLNTGEKVKAKAHQDNKLEVLTKGAHLAQSQENGAAPSTSELLWCPFQKVLIKMQTLLARPRVMQKEKLGIKI